MNKLINTWNRGFSLKNDDIRFVDESVRLAFNDTMRTLNQKGNCVILWGCEVSFVGFTATVLEGAIYWSGEIFHVFPHSYTSTDPYGESNYWNFIAEWDSSGAKTDKDLLSHQAYQIRKAVGSGSLISGRLGESIMLATPTLDSLTNSEAVLTIVYPFTKSTGRVTACRAIRHEDMITIDGAFYSLNISSFSHCAVIPLGYRPIEIVEFACVICNTYTGSHSSAICRITTNGNIYIKRLDENAGSFPQEFNLHVTFKNT